MSHWSRLDEAALTGQHSVWFCLFEASMSSVLVVRNGFSFLQLCVVMSHLSRLDDATLMG